MTSAFFPTEERRDLSFPAIRSILWDRTPYGDVMHLHYEQSVIVVRLPPVSLRQLLEYSIKHDGSEDECFLVGSLMPSKQNGNEVTSQLISGVPVSTFHLDIDRFDPGIVGTDGVRRPVTSAADEAWITVHFTRRAEFSEDDRRALVREYAQRATDERVFLLRNHLVVHCLAAWSEDCIRLCFGTVAPAINFKISPLAPIRVVSSPLSRSLGEPQRSPKTGYVTLDQQRRIVVLHEEDPRALQVPLVGLWCAGVSDPTHPFVHAAILRYLYNCGIPERVHTPGDASFLLCLWDGASRTGLPRCLECSQHSALSPPDFAFAAVEHSVTLASLEDVATVRLGHSSYASAVAARSLAQLASQSQELRRSKERLQSMISQQSSQAQSSQSQPQQGGRSSATPWLPPQVPRASSQPQPPQHVQAEKKQQATAEGGTGKRTRGSQPPPPEHSVPEDDTAGAAQPFPLQQPPLAVPPAFAHAAGGIYMPSGPYYPQSFSYSPTALPVPLFPFAYPPQYVQQLEYQAAIRALDQKLDLLLAGLAQRSSPVLQNQSPISVPDLQQLQVLQAQLRQAQLPSQAIFSQPYPQQQQQASEQVVMNPVAVPAAAAPLTVPKPSAVTESPVRRQSQTTPSSLPPVQSMLPTVQSLTRSQQGSAEAPETVGMAPRDGSQHSGQFLQAQLQLQQQLMREAPETRAPLSPTKALVSGDVVLRHSGSRTFLTDLRASQLQPSPAVLADDHTNAHTAESAAAAAPTSSSVRSSHNSLGSVAMEQGSVITAATGATAGTAAAVADAESIGARAALRYSDEVRSRTSSVSQSLPPSTVSDAAASATRPAARAPSRHSSALSDAGSSRPPSRLSTYSRLSEHGVAARYSAAQSDDRGSELSLWDIPRIQYESDNDDDDSDGAWGSEYGGDDDDLLIGAAHQARLYATAGLNV